MIERKRERERERNWNSDSKEERNSEFLQLSEEGLAYCGEKTTGELIQWNITEKNFKKKPHSKAEYDNASEEKSDNR